MIPQAHIVHRTATRLRLKVQAMRGDHDYFAELADSLGTLPGVSDLVVNPRTASALIGRLDMPVDDLSAWAQERRLFELVGPEAVGSTTRPLHGYAQGALAGIDALLRETSGGKADLRAVVFVVLVLMAARALWSGNVMAPAASLLWYAFTMAMPPSVDE